MGNTQGTTLTLAHEPLTLDEPATAHITLWGYDSRLADASATAIRRYTLEVTALPVDLELDIPANPHSLIDQGVGPVAREDAGFYFSLVVDVDRDGQQCEKDLVQDFDRSDFTSFDEEPPQTYKVFVKEYGSSCTPIDD
ncbi:hypothetical protein [Polyangium sorediatum]|uniref:Uncharacterized protein n=1 Tax=Polyangium sorediatum TaxID=889274 RepID=A0ABT6P438_9BACT|nr:hypothetical protein [Polyangium sorediatum]MDI1435367.1 hypothetical protein [Polyangium sorediatum]